ncbi:MAG: glycoside hydrolase family 13 protein [Clostridia bacterium]|nr:glycoside hydrolase family 13 protein [Clostridia bacterium]MDY5554540.1 glycoside hydrolase family 13 protein [Blautia sp.]
MEYENIDRKKKMQYILNMRPVLNKEALFSDGTQEYRSPLEPKAGDQVTIRFRTQKNNVDSVYLVSEDMRREMTLCETDNGFDYYSTQITMGEDIFRYYFEIQYGCVTCYYNNEGVTVKREPRMDFEIYPGFDTPDWARGAVMYQIFVDRFLNGDPTNDVVSGEYCYIGDNSVQVEQWNKPPAAMGVREFYGGDIQGIMNKLDYLQDLGVEVIYLNPVFVSPSNHKYDCQDYDYVDPHYGKIVADCDEGILLNGDRDNSHAYKYIRRVTDKRNLKASNELFSKFVAEVHRRGMKVILDGVFNHCGSFNKWMDRERIYENQEGYPKGAYISADSPYRHFFDFKDPDKWPYNPTYDGWWTHDTLPKLNYEESRELYDYILHVGQKWVSPPYNVDGWRLDVAADLGHSNEFNHQFWKDFRKAVKTANPDAIILAEHYGNPEGWLQGDEWDTVMNYDAFMEPVTWFLTGMEKHSDEYREDLYGNSEAFIGAMKNHMRALHMSALQTAMNELSNHDHSRFLTRTNKKVGRVSSLGPEAASQDVNPAVMREAVAIQMTWPGAPTVYYGDEAGQCGFTDPDNRRTYPWGREDYQMLDFHRVMIRIHKSYEILKNGSVGFLWNEYQGLSYARFSRDEQIIVILNNSQEERQAEIKLWHCGISRMEDAVLKRILVSDKDGFTEEPCEYTAAAGILRVSLPAYGVMILHHKK